MRRATKDESPGWGAAGLRGKSNKKRANCPAVAPVVKVRGIAAQRESTAKASGRRDVFSRLGARGALVKVANVA